MKNRYSLSKLDGQARLGSYETSHGAFSTPNFMPVGTRGSVKGIDVERLREVGAEILLVNTYHLWQRPGENVVNQLGEIHSFTGWHGPILSDSGGFQVYSLQDLRKVTEEGVEFRSHIDGKILFLSPERATEIQETLGVDIAMVLDECPPGDWDRAQVETSLERTQRWALRSLGARRNNKTSVFGITQGGRHADLRTRSAEMLAEHNFDGFAIGGLSVGEPKEVMYEVLEYHVGQLPQTHVHYLMGVGTPADIVEAVFRGIDLFDCVIPTRSGRFGRAFVSGPEPYLNIKNAQHRESNQPLDNDCDCLTCRRYSRGYLHHLFRAEEMLGPQLVSLHNLRHYFSLMQKIRQAIGSGTFTDLYRAQKDRWKSVKFGMKSD